MSDNKHDATYHGHLDEDHPTTDSITVGPGRVFIDGEEIGINGRTIPMPKQPGRYGLDVNPDTMEHRWVRIADVRIDKPRSQRIAETMGGIIGGIIVGAIVLVGVRFLVQWLWGV